MDRFEASLAHDGGASIKTTIVAKHRQDPVVALRVPRTGHEIALPPMQRVALGSSSKCDVTLDDPYISSLHCVLERRGRKCMVVSDEWSRNGTFLNGHRIERAELRPGALLRVGKTTLVALGELGTGVSSAIEQLRGIDPAFLRAIDTAMRAASTECSVLVLGETGTGKDLVARAIHEASPRASAPMVAVNCGGISSQLIGSELFGHEKGAFTGAVTERDGVFVQAAGGTLFLDELGELPLDQQPHLLRALETRTVRRLGSNHEQPVDVRLVAATNRVEGLGTDDASLRLDLYHRIATVVIELPPLRERPDDVPVLVRGFMREFAREFGQREIARTTMHALRQHPWLGNVRELRGAVMRAMALCPYELTLEQLLPTSPPTAARSPGNPPKRPMRACAPRRRYALGDLAPVDTMLRDQMLDALERYGSIRGAASSLGMAKSTFADRARRLGIPLGIPLGRSNE